MWGSPSSKVLRLFSKQRTNLKQLTVFTVQSSIDSLRLGPYGPVGDADMLRGHMTGRSGANLGDPLTEGLSWDCLVLHMVASMSGLHSKTYTALSAVL